MLTAPSPRRNLHAVVSEERKAPREILPRQAGFEFKLEFEDLARHRGRVANFGGLSVAGDQERSSNRFNRLRFLECVLALTRRARPE